MKSQTPNGNFVRLCTTALLALMILANPLASIAFKPVTHVWIAQEIINELAINRTVIIDGEEYPVADDIADAILKNPEAYRMGFIGPDTFPDVVVGQMTMHPGDPVGEWQSDRWMKELLKAAGTKEPEKAFAYGYIGHAASDIFAHTYVNTYSGDVFEIMEPNPCKGRKDDVKCWLDEGRAFRRKNVTRFGNEEKRHFALESFIAKYTPPITDGKGNPVEISGQTLKVPTKFVADFFMRNRNDVLDVYKGQALTWHLILMAEHRKNIASRVTKASAPIAADTQKQNAARDAELAAIAKLSEGDEGNESRKPDESKILKALRKVITKLGDREKDCTGPCAERWRDNIDLAMLNYVEMGGHVGIEMAKTNGKPKEAWDKWAKESSYLLLHPDLAADIRSIKDFLDRLKEKPVIRYVRKAKDYLDKKVEHLTKKIAVGGVGIFLGSSNGALLDLILFDNITAEKLNKIYKAGGSKKKLLKLGDMSARALHDMKPKEGTATFDKNHFSAIKHALTLTKMSLLGPEQLNELVRRYIGEQSPPVFSQKEGEKFNILFDAVRSIDGDHQWNEFAPPYLRRDRTGCDAQLRYYGYPNDGQGKGFKLWSTDELRTLVFRKLFPTMVAPGMYDGTMPLRKPLDPCYAERYAPKSDDPFPEIKKPAEKKVNK